MASSRRLPANLEELPSIQAFVKHSWGDDRLELPLGEAA
jgi:hypothetical protein